MMANITECSPQKAKSWATLSSTSTPIKAIEAHYQIESEQRESNIRVENVWLAVRLEQTEYVKRQIGVVGNTACVKTPAAHK